MPVRLQKFLARAGVASRRASERLIADGRVRVDGEIVSVPGTTIDPERQRVEVDGREVRPPRIRWIMLHKPPGYLCTRTDPGGRPTVYDLLDPESRPLFHVGRLDFLSEGLLLLTNEGDLAHRLLHPSSGVERRYEVAVTPPVEEGVPDWLVRGVPLEGGIARARSARWLEAPPARALVLEITLTEGRNRVIRRMLGEREIRIRKLRRVAFGPIELGALPPGEVRDLGADEVAALRALVPDPRSG